MIKFAYTIKDKDGIHARPAGMLVKEAQKFDSKVEIESKGSRADAKKIFAVMGLGVKYDDDITITAEGTDESEAINSLKEFLTKNL